MADTTQNFTDMFKKLGEQFKVPQFDMTKIVEQQQKNLDALARSWQTAAAGASAVAAKQREALEAAVKQVTEMAKEYKPTGDPQEIFAKQTEFAKKAMEAAIANTKDLAELVQKSSTEAVNIIQQRMKDSFDEIRGGLDKK
jgi:phasin family protein